MSILQLWKNRNQILEGIKNSIFKKEDIEEVARERMAICEKNECGSYDTKGEGCAMPGIQPPCCNKLTGGCGCKLSFATRVLAKECPKGYWNAVMSEEEEDLFKSKIAGQ